MLGRIWFEEGNAVMSADRDDAIKINVDLYIGRLLHAATSKDYRLAMVAVTTAEYVEHISKPKTPKCGHSTIETAH
jgi:hypothetical protein